MTKEKDDFVGGLCFSIFMICVCSIICLCCGMVIGCAVGRSIEEKRDKEFTEIRIKELAENKSNWAIIAELTDQLRRRRAIIAELTDQLRRRQNVIDGQHEIIEKHITKNAKGNRP